MCEFTHYQRGILKADEFLQAKIELARASMRVGIGYSNNEVEAEFSARRTSVTADEILKQDTV